MKLSLGMRVIETQTLNRFQVVDFDATTVWLRPLEYRATLDGRGPMAWAVPIANLNHPPREMLRGNFNVLFTGAGDQP